MSQAPPTTSEAKSTSPPSRNPFSFRLTTLFAVIAIVAIVIASSIQIYNYTPFQRFQWYVDKDLNKISKSARKSFDDVVFDLQLKDGPFAYMKGFHPSDGWYLWEWSTVEQRRFVLFTLVSNHSVELCIFDHQGEIIDFSTIQSGPRIRMINAARTTPPKLNEPVLSIDTDVAISGKIAKQHYALIDDQIVLLRLEDASGKLVRPDYTDPDYHINSLLPKRTEAEWIDALHNSRPVIILEALTWIAGERPPLSGSDGDVEVESTEDAHVVARLLKNPKAKAAVARLVGHESTWVTEAAQLALPMFEEAIPRESKETGSTE